MRAQGVGDGGVGLQGPQGGLQGVRQQGHPLGRQGGRGHLVEVLRDLRRRRQPPADAVQARRQAGGEGQIGIAGGVGTAQLHPGSLPPGRGNADQGGAVSRGPGHAAGRLIPRHQPLVGVDQGIGQGAEAPHMLQKARDELIGQRRQLPGVRLIIKGVLPLPEQRHVHMHAAAGHAGDGLGHESGVKAVFLGQGLHRQLEGHDVVGGAEGVGIFKVDLVLPGGHLVVAGLDFKAHLLQAQADLPAGGLPVVQGAQVKVSGLVAGAGGGAAVLVGLEQEELQLRPGVEGEAHVLRLPDGLLEHVPGVAHEGRAVGIAHVADQPGHLPVLGPPGQHRKGVQVRPQVLVGLLHPDKALNGAAVHHDLPVQRPLDLRRGDGHVFHLSEDIGKLHADKLDVLLPDQAEDILPGVSAHGCVLLSPAVSRII